MNELIEKVEKDFMRVMKSTNRSDLNTIRALKAAFTDASLKKGNISQPLTLDEAITIVRKQIAQRQDSIEQFMKGNRAELAEKEKSEIEVLNRFLPAEIDDDSLNGIIYLALQEFENPTKKDMGNIISKVYAACDGRADRKRIAAIVSTKIK